MNDKERCSIGIIKKEICNKQTYVKSHDIKKVSSLNDVEKDLKISRSGIHFDENATVCLHHEYVYLKRYSTIHITCCDPFNSHNGKRRKGGCKEINMQLAGKLKNIGINAISGEKICPSRMIKLISFKDDEQREPTCSQIYEDEDNEPNINELLKKNLNSTLTTMNISPLKMHAVNSHSRVALGKKKLLHIQKTVKLGIARTLNIDPEQ
ncbi:ARL14 effector protein-like [Hydra vulgaris]|uniref:ARL14 effector protein-like n=1 Tax=Hydra vulgaris TaxID=6087 RepID=UPI0032E9F58E